MPRKILACDDEKHIVRLVQVNLERAGYTVVTANDGKEALQKVQDEYRYLPQEILAFVATALDVPPATVFGVATFYAQFSLEPKGKFVIRVCDGTACHVRGNKTIIDAIRKKVGLKEGEATTKDLRYTLETVSCLGACGLAPAVVINDKIFGRVTPETVAKAIDEVESGEAI